VVRSPSTLRAPRSATNASRDPPVQGEAASACKRSRDCSLVVGGTKQGVVAGRSQAHRGGSHAWHRCGSSHHDDASKSAAVPQAFQTACSHPGAQVTVSSLPATIRRTACDLTGVTVAYRGSGVTVPENGQTAAAMLDTASGGTELYAVVDAATGDVTIRATN